MEEVEEQRYVCNICTKICVSGKSLGGHMRVHSALISASKRVAKEKSEKEIIEDRSGDQESCKNLSNSAALDEEEIEFGDGDQSSSYGLRENRKKSWRLSDPKKGGRLKTKASCKECSKDFPSMRALSGHMRSHSIKNKKAHKCGKCGKGFDSVRAMYGHMKSHSTRSKAQNDNVDDENLSSDLDNLCPVRRKRSRIGYKSAPSPSLSDLNAFEGVEEVAKCLMMLSRGKFTDSSDDDSVYYGSNSSWKVKIPCGDEGDFDDKVKINSLSSDSANAFAMKNVSEFDNLGSKLAADDYDHEVEERRQMNEIGFELDSVESFWIKQSGFGKDCLKTEADDDIILKEIVEKRERNCEAVFDSCHDLERKSFSADTKTALLSVITSDPKHGCSDSLLEKERAAGMANVAVCSGKSREHECPICFKVFTSGQALGGHRRAHYNGHNESKSKESTAANHEVADVHDLLELNNPMIAVDEGDKRDMGLNLWWADRSRGHDALVLTN